MYKFNGKKSTQAASFLLRGAGGAISFDKFWYLMYLVDRESITNTFFPLTGSCFVNNYIMLMDLYNYTKEEYWNKYISVFENDDNFYYLDNPGDGELSDYEILLIQKIYKLYGNTELTDLRCMVSILPEIRELNVGDVINPCNILRAENVSEDSIEEYKKENLYFNNVDNLFRC